MPAVIFSLRLRRCCFVRGALPRGFRPEPPPVPPPRDPPPGGRLPGGRPPPPEEAAPLRDAVVRARPLLAGFRAPPVARPPPPVLPVRAWGGRRTEPARGATGEVSSWNGTREPLSVSLWNTSVSATGTTPVAAWRLALWKPGRTRGCGPSARTPVTEGPDVKTEPRRPVSYSVAAWRRLRRRCVPGSGSAPRTYEK